MWWFLKKLYDGNDKVIYSYSRESENLDGEIECSKDTKEIKCNKLSIGDTEKSVETFYPLFYRTVFKENCPSERMIAIG
jgi:hypothetical protein